jgi:MFS family permease
MISTLTGAISPVTLYIAAALLALTSALEFPARQAFIPNLVPGSELSSALAFTITQRSIAAMAGPAAAGIVLALGGPAWCYGVDAASSSAMLLALLLIPRRPQVLGGRLGVSAAALRDGLRFVAGSRVILSLMVLDFGATFFGSPRALIPVYARDILDVGAAGLGLLYASISAGALVAGLVMAVVPTRAKAGLWVVLGVIVYAIGTMLFAISEVFWLSLLMLALSGAGNTLSAVLRGTINQTLTPDALRGRVSAVNSVFVNGGPQLGQFESGVVAALWDAKVSAFSGGLGALLVALAIAVVPNVRAFQLTEMRLPEPATTRV